MNEFILTTKGQQLVSRMIAGTSTATFTRVETSDHVYERSEIEALTALEDVKQETLISKVTRTDPALVELLVVLQNQSVAAAYNVCALGVYAKDSEQNEILFGVAVDTDTPDPVPAYGGKTVSEITYHLLIRVAASDKVDITVNPSASATVEQLEEISKPEFTLAQTRENIASKESLPVIFGKIAKFFTDLKTVAFSGSYNDLEDKPKSLPANGGNAETVNKHTVMSDVPAGAKFTDTTYSDATTSDHGLMTAAMVTKLNGIATGANKTTVANNLDSTSTTAALSAAQGKVLNAKIGAKVVLTDDDTTPPSDHSVLWVHG